MLDSERDVHAATASRGFRSHAPALIGFIVITIVMTYPTVFRMGSAVNDGRDPLFNAWVIAWNAHSLLTGSPSGLFDANIFYPAPNTAAHSEFLLPQSVVATPVFWATPNPILTYNFVLLASIVTSAFGAYLLGSYLTCRLGGFIAGLVFAFNPFMMNQLSHLQLLSAGGIPLSFLFLHKFFADGRTRNLLLFSSFYVVQSLANTYYALYLTLFAGLYILAHVVWQRRYFDGRFWLQMTLHVAVALVALTPFFYRYVELRRDFGMMVRSDESVATALSFVATSPDNRLYGDTTKAYFANEAALFPGLCAAALAAVGLWGGVTRRKRKLDHTGPAVVAIVYRATAWALVLFGALAAEILARGESTTSSLRNIVVLILALGGIRLVLKRRYAITSSVSGEWDTRWIYVSMLALALVLTIPSGFSAFVHGHVPGFEGIRSVTRIHVMSMLAISVLAAYAIAAWVARLGRRNGRLLTAIVAVVIGAEYISVPVPSVTIPSREEAPEVYRWLASQEEDFAFVEYPIDRSLQTWQVFFTTYHWKRLVTGASAFASEAYIELIQRREPVPSPSTLRDFERIGVRYLIVHERPTEDVAPEKIERALDVVDDRLRLTASFDSYDVLREPGAGRRMIVGGRARVFELTRSDWSPPRLIRELPPRAGAEISSERRTEWGLTASTNPELMNRAVDGDLSTRWYSLQRPGEFFQLDLGREHVVNGVIIDVSRAHRWAAPRGYRVEISRDAETWSIVAEDPDYLLPLTETLRPRRYRIDIPFADAAARYLRVTQTGTDDDYRWSISEIYVTTPASTEPSKR